MWTAISHLVRFDKLLIPEESKNKSRMNSASKPPSAVISSCIVLSTKSDNNNIIWLPDDILCYIFACCEARELLLGKFDFPSYSISSLQFSL